MTSINFFSHTTTEQQQTSMDFKKLTKTEQYFIGFITGLATVFTLGYGRDATFRALTKKFTTFELNKFNASLDRTVHIADKLYMDTFSSFLQKTGKRVVENPQTEALRFQKDTCFDVLSTALKEDKEKLLTDLKKFIEDNPDKLIDIYNTYFSVTVFSLDDIKGLLVCENIPQQILNEFRDSDKLSGYVWVQKGINIARCELVSAMRNVTIVLHKVNEEHEDSLKHPEINPIIPVEERIQIDERVQTLGEEYSQAYRAKERIEIAFGDITHRTTDEEYDYTISEGIFVQPHLVLRA